MSQDLNNANYKKRKVRERSAAFPLELPYRLISMFSIYGDIVLDPFWGTGTTSLAAMVSARNAIGYEINSEFMEILKRNVRKIKQLVNSINNDRLNKHIEFVRRYKNEGKELKYKANNYNFKVNTKQEIDILLYSIKEYSQNGNQFVVNHEKFEFEQKSKLIQSCLIP